MDHPKLKQSASRSTTQLNDHLHTYAPRNSAEYPDLTLSLLATLSNRVPERSGIGRDYWLDDSSALECRACERKFTTFRRKHHCRICGKIFCGACTTFIDGAKFNVKGQMRVCMTCAQLAQRYEGYSSSEEGEEAVDLQSESSGATGESVPRVEETTEESHGDEKKVTGENVAQKNSVGTPGENDTGETVTGLSTVKTLKDTTEDSKKHKEAASLESTSPAAGLPSTTPAPPPLLTIATRREGEAVEIDVPHAERRKILRARHRRQQARAQERQREKERQARERKKKSPGHHRGGSRLAPLSFSAVAANAANAASSIFNFANPHESRTQNSTRRHDNDNDNDNDNDPYIQLQRRGGPESSAISALSSSVSSSSSSSSSESSKSMSSSIMSAHPEETSSPVASPRASTFGSSLNGGWGLGMGISHGVYGMSSTQSLAARPFGQLGFSFRERGNTLAGRNPGRSPYKPLPRYHRLGRNGRITSGSKRRVSGGLHVVDNSTGFTDFQFVDDFVRASQKHGTQLLKEVLADQGVACIDEWTEALVRCMKKMSTVTLDIEKLADFHLSGFVKLKRIPSGQISDTEVINGVVISQALPLKQMPRSVNQPRIMLITFPVEYDERGDAADNASIRESGESSTTNSTEPSSTNDSSGFTHQSLGAPSFSSLEPIIAQQNEYLEKLTARISVLKPDVVLSTATINGYALRLLSKRGIAVAAGMKVQTVERVAHMTGADLITSIDRLALHPRLGRCDRFEVRSYLHERIIRTYFFFTGCDPDLGFTVVLRGASRQELAKVKECAALMVYVFYNAKLEAALMRDQCLNAPQYTPGEIAGPLCTAKVQSYRDAWPLALHRVLSSSPWVHFDPPHLLLDLHGISDSLKEDADAYGQFVDKFKLLMGDRGLPDSNRGSALSRYLGTWNIKLDVMKLPGKFDDLFHVVQKCHEFCQEMLQYDQTVTERQWDQFWASRGLAYFDPNYHQNIVTLFSMVSSKNSTPCIGPMVQLIDFYWENDFSLGQFIERLCIHASDPCPEGCGLSLKDHYRTYVHGSGKVDVVLESDRHIPSNFAPEQHDQKPSSSSPGRTRSSDVIMAWSFCKICHKTTTVLPLSSDAWKYSFGKYLELSFCCRGVKVKGSTCKHDFYRDQIHYFSFRKLAVRIEYSDIDTLRLVPPMFKVFWDPRYDVTIKLDTYSMVQKKCSDFFTSVRARLTRVKLDSTSPDKVVAGSKRLKALRARADKQEAKTSELCKHIYTTTEINEHLKLNSVIRSIQELSSEWNSEFQDFAQNYLPSEKDIRTITNFQLDKLFKSASEEDEKKKLEEAEPTEQNDEKKAIKEEAIKEEDGEEKGTSTDNKDDNAIASNDNSPRPLPVLRRSSSSVSQKKTFWEKHGSEKASKDDEEFPELDFSSGKVKKLAEFFDAREYFKQRDLEKKKMEENSYMPQVVSLKPTAEVYKDVNDAVRAEKVKDDSPNSQVVLKAPTADNDLEKSTETKETLENVQPEKISLLKSLTHFWEDRSASLWQPLAYPLNFSEHIFVDSDVIVREDEPSSIIAFCLSTSDYSSKLCHYLSEDGKNDNKEDTVEEVKEAEPADPKTGSETKTPKPAQPKETLESIMLSKGFHLKYQFEEGYSTIWCKIFFAEQFEAFRRQCGVKENFLRSLSRCVKWNSKGGKSGSAFLKTLDDRLVIKELSKTELEAFVQFAPSYFEYFAQALFHNLPTVLVKIFGFYQIQVKNSFPGGKSYTMDVLIMENLFYNRKMSRIFDLKGSMRNRHAEQTGKENEVLLDENMVEYIYESPLFVRENAKRLLRASLWNDTLFLSKMNVMDYSLVVGIDSKSKELVVGIIDCIRTFTWDKKLESWVKEKGLVGGSGVGREPTVITPKQYKNRFREAMERYILMAPGAYYQGTT